MAEFRRKEESDALREPLLYRRNQLDVVVGAHGNAVVELFVELEFLKWNGGTGMVLWVFHNI